MGVPDQKGVKWGIEWFNGSEWYDLEKMREHTGTPRELVYSSEDEAMAACRNRARTMGYLYRPFRLTSEAGRTPTPPSPVVPSETGTDLKIGTSEKKPPLSLCPLGSLAGEARVRQYGNKKYADGNYLTADASKETVRRYISGVLRHLSVVQTNGVNARDEESGLPHLDHAIVGLRMLREIATKHGVIPEDPGEGNDPPRL